MAEIPWMNEDGTLVEGFAEQALPEELRSYAQDAKNFSDLVKRGHDTRKEFSERVALPKEGGTVEFMRKHFGAPETADAYELGKPSDWPEDVPFNESMVTKFAETAAQIGAPKAMVQELAANIMSAETETAKRMAEDALNKQAAIAEASEKKLKELWGDKFDAEMELARRGFNSDSIPETLKETIRQRAGVKTLTDEIVLKALRGDAVLGEICHAFGALAADDNSVSGSGSPAANDVKTSKPMYAKTPELYRNRPDSDPDKAWFIANGYDFTAKKWEGGPPG